MKYLIIGRRWVGTACSKFNKSTELIVLGVVLSNARCYYFVNLVSLIGTFVFKIVYQNTIRDVLGPGQ